MSITVTNITKLYGKQKALNAVSFNLREGEICGFLGPNGAGKSTMMKIITGYLNEYEGDVKVCNTDLRKQPLKAKERIGYLSEHNPLYPDMYIKEYLLHVAHLYRTPEPDKRVEEIIEQTGLTPERTKKIGKLSKGFRQRVGLAQALVHDPEILILDEPMTGLDPNQLEEIRNLIIRIGKNKTVMLSTHIMQEVEAICNRIIIINKGEIVADKCKQEFHATAGGLIIDVHFAPAPDYQWLNQLRGIESVEEIAAGNYQLAVTAGTDPRIDLFNMAAENRCPIIELKTEERNLEEIFRQLTQ